MNGLGFCPFEVEWYGKKKGKEIQRSCPNCGNDVFNIDGGYEGFGNPQPGVYLFTVFGKGKVPIRCDGCNAPYRVDSRDLKWANKRE
ncbi:MAG: hypothetical protein GXO64_03550 [Candidatus Micrarchaeota archaeon]|nr:hypothetical protein [Candidatus Micrarchaeota archaeon]